MSPLNIGLVLLSSFLHALWNILTQSSKNSQYFSGLKGIWITVMALAAYAGFGMAPLNNEIIFGVSSREFCTGHTYSVFPAPI